MRRSFTITLLSVSLGMPAVIAETCRVDFKEVWARKVKAIQAWNKSHASYVARHHLDRDMSASTRRMKERARKALEVMCGEVDGSMDAELDLMGGIRSGDDTHFLGTEPHPEADVVSSPAYLEGMVANAPYPIYETYAGTPLVDGERGPYTGFPGWFGSAGYLPGGGRGTTTPPVIQPTPEPMTLALLGTGVLLGWRLKCR